MTLRSESQPILLHLLAATALVLSLAACSERSAGPSTTAGADAGAASGAGADAGADTRSGESAQSAPAPSPSSNAIRWTTASEVGNYGFDVYRADSADGPFERLTERPILGAGTTDMPSDYEYVDDTIEPGREYYYYVESISAEGERSRFTPIQRAPPKPGASAGGDTDSAAEGQPEQ